MKKPKGIDGEELYIIKGDEEAIPVNDWEEAKERVVNIAMDDEEEAIIVKVIARADYTPAHVQLVEA